MTHTRINPTPFSHGFTLVEIMVVVVIIVVLIGIGLAVGPEVLGAGEKHRTRVTLANAHTLMQEYMRVVGAAPGDIDEMVAWATKVERFQPLLNGFDKDTLKKEASTYKLYDAWDAELYLNPDGSTPPSGKVIADYDGPYIASKGPNGEWGKTNGNDDEKELAADNMYSFESD